MTLFHTALGTMRIGNREALYGRLAAGLLAAAAEATNAVIGLSGGSTPRDFYRWAVEAGSAGLAEAVRHLRWTASDERCVPLDHPDSNFGCAQREFLDPLGVPIQNRLPWPVRLPPVQAGQQFCTDLQEWVGHTHAFDLCLLGMGADGHTASIFPGSPLLHSPGADLFAAVEVPAKGWRLTITPAGLNNCRRIFILVSGEGKAGVLRQALAPAADSIRFPIRLLTALADRTEWLIDEGSVEPSALQDSWP